MFRKVKSRDLALNPVAAAVALNNVRKLARDGLTKLYLAEDGLDVKDVINSFMDLITAACYISEARGNGDTPDSRVMRAAQGVCVEASHNGFKWRARWAVAIDQGVKRALDVTSKVRPREIVAAYKQMALDAKEAWQKHSGGANMAPGSNN